MLLVVSTSRLFIHYYSHDDFRSLLTVQLEVLILYPKTTKMVIEPVSFQKPPSFNKMDNVSYGEG